MKRILWPAILFAFILSSSAFAVSSDVKWNNLKDGIVKATAENKPIIVDFFFGKGCPRCEKLEKGIYTNPAISKKINEDFVPVLIDLTKPLTREEEDLGTAYDYKNDCIMLFLDPEMKIIKDPSGRKMCFVDNIEPEIFIGYLDMIRGQMKK